MAAGLVNALAGGGSLISFPALLAAGLPAVVANVTNTIALLPGYAGASLSQWADLQPQRSRLWRLLPAALAGGLLGAQLLLHTSDQLFRLLVPWLILTGSGLLAVQDPLRRWLPPTGAGGAGHDMRWWTAPALLLASIYGGYFGAGLSVIALAVLALGLDDSFTRLSGLKQALAFAVNLSAACVFLGSGRVSWAAAGLMAAGSILGGLVGGRIASCVHPVLLRQIVVGSGISIGLVYLWRSLQA